MQTKSSTLKVAASVATLAIVVVMAVFIPKPPGVRLFPGTAVPIDVVWLAPLLAAAPFLGAREPSGESSRTRAAGRLIFIAITLPLAIATLLARREGAEIVKGTALPIHFLWWIPLAVSTSLHAFAGKGGGRWLLLAFAHALIAAWVFVISGRLTSA